MLSFSHVKPREERREDPFLLSDAPPRVAILIENTLPPEFCRPSQPPHLAPSCAGNKFGAPDTKMIGAGGIDVWKFLAHAEGTSKITLDYK